MICTFCLSDNQDLINLSNEQNTEENIVEIITQYFEFLKDQINSIEICWDCWEKIRNFHKFYLKVLENNATVDIKDIKNSDIQSSNSQDDLFEVKTENDNMVFDIKNELEDLDDFDMIPSIPMKADEETPPTTPALKEQNNKEMKMKIKLPKKKSLKARKEKSSSKKKELKPKPPENLEYKMASAESEKLIKEHIKLDCEICSHSCSGYLDTMNHYRKAHKVKGYLKCCDEKFKKRSLLVDHIKYHIDPKTFECDVCNRAFKNRKYLSLHKVNHDEHNLRCPHPGCDKLFSRQYRLKLHETSVHRLKEGETIKCTDCDKIFPSLYRMRYHKKVEHTDQSRSWFCDICGVTLKTEVNLKNHMKNHNIADIEMVKCKYCENYYKRGSSISRHIRLHLDSLKEFPCPDCGKFYPNSTALRNHVRRVHIQQRTHQCTACDKAFKTALNLKEHIASHGNSQILYQCSVCMKNFNSNANMHSHRKKMHPEEWKELVRQREEALFKKKLEMIEASAAAAAKKNK